MSNVLEDTVKSIPHIRRITIQDEYGTPQHLFDEACKEFNLELKVDLAASKSNHVLPNYITKEDDLFNHEITQDSYLNPPYSKIDRFIPYIFEQHIKYNVDILLLIYNKTDTRWWHKYIENHTEIHFIKGRIQFNDEHGKPKMIYDKKSSTWKNGPAPYPSVWVIFRKK